MNNEPFANWRGWVAAGLLAIVAITIVAAWPETPAKPPASIAAAPQADLLTPSPLKALNRFALIDAAASAASSYAAGMSADRNVTDMAGRRFELILPFGCEGPTPPKEVELVNGWRYDEESGVLQVTFPSSIQHVAEITSEQRASDYGGVRLSKGFWIEREWLRAEICPPSDQTNSSEALDDPSLAIVELAVNEAPRAESRQGAPYRVSKRLSAEQAPTGQGLRIVIKGRLAIDGGAPIQCRSAHRNTRPTCFILARFDGVAVTDSSGSNIYGEWTQ